MLRPPDRRSKTLATDAGPMLAHSPRPKTPLATVRRAPVAACLAVLAWVGATAQPAASQDVDEMHTPERLASGPSATKRSSGRR